MTNKLHPQSKRPLFLSRVSSKNRRTSSENHFTADPILQKRIRTIARGDEDRAQTMYLNLLERANADQTFASQQVGYHIKAAKFAAQHDVTKGAIYNKYVEGESFMQDDDGTEVSVFDTLASSDETPETICERHETAAALAQAIAQLPANRRQIAELLLKGYEANEIAQVIGSTTSSVNHIISKTLVTLRQSL